MKLGKSNASVEKSNERCSFQFTPAAIAVALYEFSNVTYRVAAGNDFDERNRADDLKRVGVVRHAVTIAAVSVINRKV
jgi:hypothetical protein